MYNYRLLVVWIYDYFNYLCRNANSACCDVIYCYNYQKKTIYEKKLTFITINDSYVVCLCRSSCTGRDRYR